MRITDRKYEGGDCGRCDRHGEGSGGGVREGKEWGYGESRLTRISPFVV